jgi:hypothetical protein
MAIDLAVARSAATSRRVAAAAAGVALGHAMVMASMQTPVPVPVVLGVLCIHIAAVVAAGLIPGRLSLGGIVAASIVVAGLVALVLFPSLTLSGASPDSGPVLACVGAGTLGAAVATLFVRP